MLEEYNNNKAVPIMTSSKDITVRKMDFDLSDVPKDYMNGDQTFSNIFDGLNLLFPEGERFFMRSVRDGINTFKGTSEADQELKQQAKGFFGQEAQHANEHEKFFDVLENNGYEFRETLGRVDTFILKMSGKLPMKFRLSMTAGAEHLTAVLGSLSLQEEDVNKAHPAMKQLIHWHAVEEIEHKAVAFDVFQKVSGNYPLRILGYLMSSIFIKVVSRHFSVSFMMQDGLKKGEAKRRIRRRERLLRKTHSELFKQLGLYLKPSFHPNQIDEGDAVETAVLNIESYLLSKTS